MNRKVAKLLRAMVQKNRDEERYNGVIISEDRAYRRAKKWYLSLDKVRKEEFLKAARKLVSYHK